MENVLFKISFPAEFHSQTAVEAAVTLHPDIINRLDDIDYITIRSHEAALRIIAKNGPLHNPADRDHCLQYMIAIGLLHGNLTAEDYEHDVAADPRIDVLRDKMRVVEEPQFTVDYHDPNKRSIANALQIFFKDGTQSKEIVVEYPIGHRRRRSDGIPLLIEKFKHAVTAHYDAKQAEKIMVQLLNKTAFEKAALKDIMELLQTHN